MQDVMPYDPIQGQGQDHNCLKATQEELTVSLARDWPPYVIGQAIIFLLCGFFLSIFYLSFFIPRLISAAAGWMSTIL